VEVKGRRMTKNDRDIRICDNKGFHLDLPNNVTVSVQIGPGNYCDSDVSNADFDAPKNVIGTNEMWGSNTAECAAYVTGSNLAWVEVPGYTDVGGCDVCGYLNVSQVLDFINLASKLTGFAAEANPDSIGNKMIEYLDTDAHLKHGDYRDDLVKDERKVMDEFAIDEYFSNKESNDEDSA
jgi:hypothetical protein